MDHYRIAAGKTVKELEKEVNNLVKFDHYKPLGGLFISDGWFYQNLFRSDK